MPVVDTGTDDIQAGGEVVACFNREDAVLRCPDRWDIVFDMDLEQPIEGEGIAIRIGDMDELTEVLMVRIPLSPDPEV